MDYVDELSRAGRKSAQAKVAAAQADGERDVVIRRANHHGGLSARDISALVGISHQRVAQIINADPIAPRRRKLHEAMVIVLEGYGTDWVSVHDIARLVTERGLYHRKDRQPVPPGQIRARAAKYPLLFEGTRDGTNRIRLRRAAVG